MKTIAIVKTDLIRAGWLFSELICGCLTQKSIWLSFLMNLSNMIVSVSEQRIETRKAAELSYNEMQTITT